ncbi:unnamed protein product [Parnassius apollo]|uniref:(apollo) hypothetical protein n=1 Tax=Parnassius apollo TaxID=110799 RepID=A0A8S3WNR7_PARAO|nr:unnamed protein product [Parnassius apollo]
MAIVFVAVSGMSAVPKSVGFEGKGRAGCHGGKGNGGGGNGNGGGGSGNGGGGSGNGGGESPSPSEAPTTSSS